MAEAVVSTTLDTLRDLLVEKVRFLSGVRNQVEELERELVRMKCFLKDADTRQHKDERVQNWVREVKDLCYQVEDVLETFVVEVESKRSSGKGIKRVVNRFACLLSEGIALHKVGVDIAKIKAHIIDLRTSLQMYGIQELRDDGESSKEANERQWRLRQTYAHEVDEHFVGMEDEISQLVSMIVENNKGHQDRVISIYGMGGLGKTTLARKIFHHAKVKHCFEAFAWHCISQRYDFKLVLRDILKQLVGESKRSQLISDMEEAELVRELNNVQTQNKCLIVLDDVWKMDDWRELRKAFPIANQAARSKILLTTRNEEVAEVAERGYRHKLRCLTEEEGWQLLQKIVFLGQEKKDIKRDQKLESVGREILGKCGGLPLAISALGGILKRRNTLSEWEIVSKDVDLYLSESEANKDGSQPPVHVLALSYNDLPYNLKSCFLNMGHFQEDEEIEARKLYHLWIAEGMVSSVHRRNEETMMDVAERNLSELASRSMVQVKMDNLSIVGRIKSCKLHDLMRDLCLKKGKEEGFLENLDIDDQGGTNARRLAICFGGSLMESFRQVITNQFLRALSVHRAPLRGPLDFSLCRVLDFQRCAFQDSKLPKEISKMVHLRYLSVYGCYLRKLPSFIGDLQYLEILDLRTISNLYLPNIFSKMKRLRHLYLYEFHSGLEKLQLNGLSGLETLVGFKSEGFRHKDLSDLVNLQYFDAILGSDDWSLIIDHINSWKKIKWVKIGISLSSLEQTHFGKLLTCRNLNDLEVHRCPIGKLPQYELQFWPNLVRLYLYRTIIDEDSMEFLKKLPKLRELILYSYAFYGEEFICDATDFPQLRSLKIHFQPNLEKWRIGEGALPNLSSLLIDDNKKLEIIPEDGLRCLINLEELEIIHMPEEFRHKYGMLHDQQREDMKEAPHEIS